MLYDRPIQLKPWAEGGPLTILFWKYFQCNAPKIDFNVNVMILTFNTVFKIRLKALHTHTESLWLDRFNAVVAWTEQRHR